jgi:CBS domain-containing protein
MTLGELLRIKGSGDVLKISASECIADAATKMTANKIGALLVESAAGEIVGILSERDIVGGMGPHGADLHDVPVSELMTADLIRCKPTDTVNDAMAMMTDRRIRHLPVFNGDDLVGFISVGDLVKCRISEVQAEAEAMRQYIAS